MSENGALSDLNTLIGLHDAPYLDPDCLKQHVATMAERSSGNPVYWNSLKQELRSLAVRWPKSPAEMAVSQKLWPLIEGEGENIVSLFSLCENQTLVRISVGDFIRVGLGPPTTPPNYGIASPYSMFDEVARLDCKSLVRSVDICGVVLDSLMSTITTKCSFSLPYRTSIIKEMESLDPKIGAEFIVYIILCDMLRESERRFAGSSSQHHNPSTGYTEVFSQGTNQLNIGENRFLGRPLGVHIPWSSISGVSQGTRQLNIDENRVLSRPLGGADIPWSCSDRGSRSNLPASAVRYQQPSSPVGQLHSDASSSQRLVEESIPESFHAPLNAVNPQEDLNTLFGLCNPKSPPGLLDQHVSAMMMRCSRNLAYQNSVIQGLMLVLRRGSPAEVAAFEKRLPELRHLIEMGSISAGCHHNLRTRHAGQVPSDRYLESQNGSNVSSGDPSSRLHENRNAGAMPSQEQHASLALSDRDLESQNGCNGGDPSSSLHVNRNAGTMLLQELSPKLASKVNFFIASILGKISCQNLNTSESFGTVFEGVRATVAGIGLLATVFAMVLQTNNPRSAPAKVSPIGVICGGCWVTIGISARYYSEKCYLLNLSFTILLCFLIVGTVLKYGR